MHIREITRRFRFDDGKNFRLGDIDPSDTCGLDVGKDAAKKLIADDAKRLRALQERLYAEGRHSVLVVLQAMDAAGKDGVVEHVMSGVNPQGCDVHSFKAPSSIELRHDFLWRLARVLPERGRIGIFNRSHYEEVLAVRVVPGLLEAQNLPPEVVGPAIWEQRFEDIRAFERQLARSGTVILKFFLHVSKEEQRKRLLDRIEEPEKRWKFDPGDVDNRKRWNAYMDAYEDAVRHTATEFAPWHVVPADDKWFCRIVVAAAIVEALEKIDPKFPRIDPEKEHLLEGCRVLLEKEGGGKA